LSGHKPGADHAENPEYPAGLAETGELIGTTGSTPCTTPGGKPEASPGGRSRIGIVAVTGALVLGGSVTAYGVASHGDSPSRQTAQALSLTAGQAAADTTAVQRAAADRAADSAAAETAAQHQAATAGAKAAADKATADKAAADAAAKAAADRAAAAAQANRDAQRQPLPAKTPARTSTPAPSRSTSSPPAAAYGSPQAIAQSIVPASQYKCFATIIQRESGWNVHATNPSSGAYGLGQALPASKMASAGSDWQNNPATQIKWTLSYMDHRYGSPCAALAFWNSHGWY
jgi:hypothetical protein